MADEVKLERALASNRDLLDELLRDEHTGVSDAKRAELLGSYSRDRRLVEKLNLLYKGAVNCVLSIAPLSTALSQPNRITSTTGRVAGPTSSKTSCSFAQTTTR